MKYPFLVTVLVLATVASSFVTADLSFSVTVQGVEGRNVLEAGLKPSELTSLTIASSDTTKEIEAFEILLARGKSPVGFPVSNVDGNACDLKKFRGVAKPGDRIVIRINRISDNVQFPEKIRILQIPIR